MAEGHLDLGELPVPPIDKKALPHLHDWFRVCAFFPRLDPSVGRGHGRSESGWAPHRGRRRLDTRNKVARRRWLDHAQSDGLPGRTQSTRFLLLLRFGRSLPAEFDRPRWIVVVDRKSV